MKRKRKRRSHARLDPVTRGVIWGMHLAKAPREEILKHVVTTDGSVPTMKVVDAAIKKETKQTTWTEHKCKMNTTRHANAKEYLLYTGIRGIGAYVHTCTHLSHGTRARHRFQILDL